MLSGFLQAMQNPGQLNTLMQQFQPPQNEASGWGQQPQQFFQNNNGNNMAWEASDTSWGGAGRGNNGRGGPRRKRNQVCNFFLVGRCKYGDSCDFSHDVPAS